MHDLAPELALKAGREKAAAVTCGQLGDNPTSATKDHLNHVGTLRYGKEVKLAITTTATSPLFLDRRPRTRRSSIQDGMSALRIDVGQTTDGVHFLGCACGVHLHARRQGRPCQSVP